LVTCDYVRIAIENADKLFQRISNDNQIKLRVNYTMVDGAVDSVTIIACREGLQLKLKNSFMREVFKFLERMENASIFA